MNQAWHILTIEDDPAVGRSLHDGLVRDGYMVTWKLNGAEGVKFARAYPAFNYFGCAAAGWVRL